LFPRKKLLAFRRGDSKTFGTRTDSYLKKININVNEFSEILLYGRPEVYILKIPPPGGGGYQPMSFGGKNVKSGSEKGKNVKEKEERGKKKRKGEGKG
jgi:hypothetical protein